MVVVVGFAELGVGNRVVVSALVVLRDSVACDVICFEAVLVVVVGLTVVIASDKQLIFVASEMKFV